MTQYLRGAFSVGAKPGESKEMDDNWERTFGKKAVSDAVLVDQALEPLRADVLKGIEANERMEKALREVVRLAKLNPQVASPPDAVVQFQSPSSFPAGGSMEVYRDEHGVRLTVFSGDEAGICLTLKDARLLIACLNALVGDPPLRDREGLLDTIKAVAEAGLS